MAYQALYRKWRPRTFDDVVGQTHVVATLKNEITSEKTAHAYLFCGTRGTGKTSCAKIFARAINCRNPKNGNPCNECEICLGELGGSIMDITEIDAASNNGVDNIREIRDEVSYSAAQAKYKIYIIDEVHMLSGGAFNALLKTLEEPPPHVVFILATTEAHKLPATITSRCQRFDFKRISVHDIVIRLREITAAEGIAADVDALELIARLADGAMRDALSILDQCAGALGGAVTADGVNSIMGCAADTVLAETVEAIADKNKAALLRVLADTVQSGRDINSFMDFLINRFRDILICKVTGQADELFEYSNETIADIEKAAKRFSAQELSYITEELCAASAEAKWQKNAKVLYELALLRLCDERLCASNAALLSRLEKLEQALAGTTTAVLSDAADLPKTPEKPQDDAPPWDTETPETVNTLPAAAHKAPTLPRPKRPTHQTTASNRVWTELLGILQKKYPPLYGAIFMKKAKYFNSTLYLVNEVYVKEIINLYSDDFTSALHTVCGSAAKLSFVTQTEFDTVEGDADCTAAAPEDNAVKSASGSEVQTADCAENEKEDTETSSSGDPLDALLTLNNDDIIIEDE